MSDIFPPPAPVKTKWYEESPEVVSGKRVAGAAVLAVGCAMKIVLFLVCVFSDEFRPNAQLADSISTSVMVIGGSLLGVTVLEGIGSRIGRGGQIGGVQ